MDNAAKDSPVGLLLGYGSIGRHHARLLSGMVSKLVIVDISDSARARAGQDHPGARVVDSLAALDGSGLQWASALGVIATLGPSHAELFHALADRGVRRFLCEKPLANSVAGARAMVQRAETENLAIGVHHYIRWARLTSALQRFAAEYRLGNPLRMIVEGGAACLVTNGIHWIDFAMELFGSQPRRVTSTAHAEPINPRSRELQFYEGTAVWSFDGNREAVVTFNNRSSLGLTARVLFRDAVAQMDPNLNVSIVRRDPTAVERFPEVTRTGPASVLLFEGQLPGVRSQDEWMADALEQTCSGSVRTAPGSVGLASVAACIGALVSAREGKGIDLPIDPSGPLDVETWPIS